MKVKELKILLEKCNDDMDIILINNEMHRFEVIDSVIIDEEMYWDWKNNSYVEKKSLIII